MGAYFRPQQSLRTLANINNPSAPDIKLPITILNTSCYRGIPGKTICAGAEISRWLKDICAQDTELKNTVVLEEIAGVHIGHPLWGSIAEPPYRFNETLGAIWRLPVGRFLGANQQAVMLGSLWQTDNSGEPLLATWLEQSGLPLAQWLNDLFQHMVVPLYHLLAAYGIGLIAHGQNITLILTQGRVTGMAIKDFQGDLRLDDRLRKSHKDLSAEGYRAIDKLPAHYLIHDLQTGNFLTALRFISALCWRKLALPEIRFYQLLAQAIRKYQGRHAELIEHYQRFDLFAPSVAKLCINRVRFAIGYDDSALRPKPIRGRDIDNPLYLADSMHHSNTTLETSCTTI
jgi:aerobactin synthase